MATLPPHLAGSAISLQTRCPIRIAVFGRGRVGSTFAAYAAALGHEVETIAKPAALARTADARGIVQRADLVAAAIPDDALDQWRTDWAGDTGERRAIHFSGARVVKGMTGYHPLYSFPRAALEPVAMGSIAIAREEGAPPFADMVPGATNPEFVIKAADRALYHALAVVSGNFAAHLWNATAEAFARRFHIAPETVLSPYFASLVDRFAEAPLDSLTGPVARRDARTVELNLDALREDPQLQSLYRAFLASAWPEFPIACPETLE